MWIKRREKKKDGKNKVELMKIYCSSLKQPRFVVTNKQELVKMEKWERKKNTKKKTWSVFKAIKERVIDLITLF